MIDGDRYQAIHFFENHSKPLITRLNVDQLSPEDLMFKVALPPREEYKTNSLKVSQPIGMYAAARQSASQRAPVFSQRIGTSTATTVWPSEHCTCTVRLRFRRLLAAL